MAHAGPVTGRTGETLELVCEAAGDDHIKSFVIAPCLSRQVIYLDLPNKLKWTSYQKLSRQQPVKSI